MLMDVIEGNESLCLITGLWNSAHNSTILLVVRYIY